jgi:hypothetical protein
VLPSATPHTPTSDYSKEVLAASRNSPFLDDTADALGKPGPVSQHRAAVLRRRSPPRIARAPVERTRSPLAPDIPENLLLQPAGYSWRALASREDVVRRNEYERKSKRKADPKKSDIVEGVANDWSANMGQWGHNALWSGTSSVTNPTHSSDRDTDHSLPTSPHPSPVPGDKPVRLTSSQKKGWHPAVTRARRQVAHFKLSPLDVCVDQQTGT